ncbi:peptide chain release factor N(5)-glutamine methyltransferase [Limosilactobacillus sp. STM2_1]|uniref:Release factor glutamine methyltransferase n=1 Tax=Limosilactobacillus rudii TaxID=2759755 RepID=A0A7W3YP65_9LACO|nr:peptide chain release factor N(5)-glutamine methyltransferase [Limosilactobacillus rudii]MBB1079948.1 peptide chain release factor N(5)-glutamine methyltransferase [Limosilactobacillus rudii]MBB1098027.1 peptide chain release factor N(5)-glutamine methyltransferase [Limosilactobacillus rudii]MCD7135096.1 peptide chain release factor N(5)-glutamine methyltransferase [Limosilactobacillus rudii]
MNNFTPQNYFMAQRWAKEQLSGTDIDLFAPQFLLQQRHGWDATHLLLHNRDQMPDNEVKWWHDAIIRLLNHEPAQYIVGQAPFYGRTFRLNKHVLIPEAETAELIEWVLATMPADPLKVLDLGTGSGVIGITLALERPKWDVTLSDISPAALKVAQQNMTTFGLDLPLIESDLFANISQRFDLIVTNPPYIDKADTGVMDKAVLANEPALALFADEHGLGFYHRLFKLAGQHLTTNGQLFGETGYDQEESIQTLLHQTDRHARICPRHDVAGKMRMIHAWDFSDAGGR